MKERVKKRTELPRRLLDRYLRHFVGATCASMAYYLMFSIFPLLISISAVLGKYNLTVDPYGVLSRVIPASILEFYNSYIEYAVSHRSTQLIIWGMVFGVYFVLRSVHCVTRAVKRALGVPVRDSSLRYFLMLILRTVVFILMIIVMLAVIVVGTDTLNTLSALWTFIGPEMVEIWGVLRFALLAAVMFFLLNSIYYALPGRVITRKQALPGTCFALLFWLIFSMAFAYYVANLGNYSLFYGSIGAIIVLLLWIYASSLAIIMGAELNGALDERRRGKAQ